MTQPRRHAASAFTAVAAAVLVLLLSAVAGPSRAQQPARVLFLTSDTAAERLGVYRYVADAFEALHPGIRVEIEPVSQDRITLRLDEEPRPAVVNTVSDLILGPAGEGLLDADAATRVLHRIGGPGAFYRSAVEAFGIPGGTGVFAVPFHGWIHGIWYRADWFAEAGLPPPDTPDAMLRAAEAFRDRAAGRHGIFLPRGGDLYSQQILLHLAAALGARLIDEDGSSGLDGPAWTEALRLYARLYETSPQGIRGTRGRDYYVQGRAAMMFYSTFVMDDIAVPTGARDALQGGRFPDLPGAPFDPDLVGNTGVATVLTGRTRAAAGAISGLAFPAGLDDATLAAAERFVGFLFERGPHIAWLHAAPGGMLPVRRGIATDPAYLHEQTGTFRRYGAERIAAIVEGFETLRLATHEGDRPDLRAAAIVADLIVGRMLERVVDGTEPEAAAAAAHAEAEALIGR
jgi:multiple sugar transport system substrate-binding protein